MYKFVHQFTQTYTNTNVYCKNDELARWHFRPIFVPIFMNVPESIGIGQVRPAFPCLVNLSCLHSTWISPTRDGILYINIHIYIYTYTNRYKYVEMRVDRNAWTSKSRYFLRVSKTSLRCATNQPLQSPHSVFVIECA